jgi:hypothetical protein
VAITDLDRRRTAEETLQGPSKGWPKGVIANVCPRRADPELGVLSGQVEHSGH